MRVCAPGALLTSLVLPLPHVLFSTHHPHKTQGVGRFLFFFFFLPWLGRSSCEPWNARPTRVMPRRLWLHFWFVLHFFKGIWMVGTQDKTHTTLKAVTVGLAVFVSISRSGLMFLFSPSWRSSSYCSSQCSSRRRVGKGPISVCSLVSLDANRYLGRLAREPALKECSSWVLCHCHFRRPWDGTQPLAG